MKEQIQLFLLEVEFKLCCCVVKYKGGSYFYGEVILKDLFFFSMAKRKTKHVTLVIVITSVITSFVVLELK